MEHKIIIAGSGGQGILFLGRMLVMAAVQEGKHATWFPSYGAEMRGGKASCTVIISDEMIGSPVVLNPDILVAMNRESLVHYLPALRKKGLLFFDSSLAGRGGTRKDISSVAVPAMRIAGEMQRQKSANMVMLGALAAKTALFRQETLPTLFASGSDAKQAALFSENYRLVRKGIEYIENS